jgi:MarR family transcriptional regulator, temperature-dependent positive regulator of motility
MFEHCLYFNTAATARVLEREWAKAFAPFDLTPPQAFMLRYVLEHPGVLQSELASALTVSRPTATRLLDGLEEKLLLNRRTPPGDARTVEIYPTAAAVALRDGLNAASSQVTRQLKRALGTSVFDDVVAQLRAVRSAVK